ncbi:MAG: DUF4157 domain-containing protein [Niabella sp.]|nr:DUF4157 domain-containing protein [Niabella sp.]
MHCRGGNKETQKEAATATTALTGTPHLNGISLKSLPVQRAPIDEHSDMVSGEMEEDETSESLPLQKKCMECEAEDVMQRSALAPFDQVQSGESNNMTAAAVSKKIQATAGTGQPLPETTKSFMESRFGASFSDVHIHTGRDAADLSSALQAQAFTTGNDIYFNEEKFTPNTTEGKKLIAHELTHTLQQKKGGTTAQPKVQRSFWSFVKEAAGAVWSGVKKVGGWIAKGAEWLGGQLLDKIDGVLQRVTFWISQLPARVGRLFATVWRGLKTFKPWTVKWWKSLAETDTWKNFLKWTGTLLLQSAEIGGLGEVYETLEDIAKFNTRTLSGAELKAARSVFGNSVNLAFVRVDTGAAIGPAFSHRAYTSFHTINSWGTETIDTMIHELTHVWQYENAGAIYMPQAVHAQVWGGGYDYGDVAGLQKKQAAGEGLLSFNREQQAQIVEDFFRLREGIPIPGGSAATIADLPLYADFVKTVSTLSKTKLMQPM